MEKEKFLGILDAQDVQYRIADGKIIIHNGGDVDLGSLTSLPEGIEFHNGRDVYLESLTSLPEGVEFHNGRDVYLGSRKLAIYTSYLERFGVPVVDGYCVLYKRVSAEYKTQEGMPYETQWRIGQTITHPAWSPEAEECGGGKFHACARPGWCDIFRCEISDKYISIRINVKDLYEWATAPVCFPQKIGFRRGTVIGEVTRNGEAIWKR